jgi:hypothetical protein
MRLLPRFKYFARVRIGIVTLFASAALSPSAAFLNHALNGA